MAKNYEIKTVSKWIVGGATASAAYRRTAIGSSVAAGMTRYVTFIQMSPVAAGGSQGSKVFICSAAASDTANATAAASANQKTVIVIGSATAANSMSVPSAPDTEHPLFTVASGKFLSAYICSVVGQSSPVQLFTQYFDE